MEGDSQDACGYASGMINDPYRHLKNPYPRSEHIQGIRWLGEQVPSPGVEGDTWSPVRADDGNVYTPADDTLGEGYAISSNLAIYRVQGAPPNHAPRLVNAMSEYGTAGRLENLASWKANGMTFVDGSLYLSVSQHRYWRADNIQQARDASIVRSDDYGVTWTPKPEMGRAMFPDDYFATPFFVNFTGNYDNPRDRFVYAISNDGCWNNGSFMMLARVHRLDIARLDEKDWEYFAGLDAQGRPTWRSQLYRVDRKAPEGPHGYPHDKLVTPAAMFRDPHRVGMTGMQWVPAVERFILCQWFHPDYERYGFGRTTLILLEAPDPWGPWSWFHVEEDWGNAMYCPALPGAWFEDGGKRMWLTGSGAFWGHPRPDYSLVARPLELVVR